MNTTTTPITAAVSDLSTPQKSLVRGAAIGAATALAGNLVLFAAGSIGEPIRVVIGADAAPKALTVFEVAATTVISIVVGALVLAITRWRGLADRTWAIGTAVVAVVSAVPLWSLPIDTSSQVLLTTMHLLTGVCCVVAQRRRA